MSDTEEDPYHHSCIPGPLSVVRFPASRPHSLCEGPQKPQSGCAGRPAVCIGFGYRTAGLNMSSRKQKNKGTPRS